MMVRGRRKEEGVAKRNRERGKEGEGKGKEGGEEDRQKE